MPSDNDLLRLLAEIEAMALRHYPFPDDARLDPRLTFALGRIAGIAGAAVRRDHVASPTCWCNPVPDDREADVWIHNYQPAQLAALQGEDAA
jgi:hypothetical protein